MPQETSQTILKARKKLGKNLATHITDNTHVVRISEVKR